jgi:hypothetical protein
MDSNLFVFFFWQSNGKAEKFFGDFGWLEAGRESTILVSGGFGLRCGPSGNRRAWCTLDLARRRPQAFV